MFIFHFCTLKLNLLKIHRDVAFHANVLLKHNTKAGDYETEKINKLTSAQGPTLTPVLAAMASNINCEKKETEEDTGI